MKNIFTFLLGSLMAVSVFAADAGRVTVSFYGNQDYQVFIDGRSIYSGNNNKTYLNDVRAGQHTIEVYRTKRNNKRNNRPVYSNQFVVRPQYDLNIIVDRDGTVRFDEDRAYGNRGYNGNDRNRNDRDDDYNNNNNNGYGNGGYGRDRDGDRNKDRNYGYGNNRGWDNDYNKAISDADFNQLYQKIRNQWNGKLNTAREAVTNNYFTVNQVRQLLQLFTAENDRLDLAKQVYRKTVDQRAFSQLYDLFSAQAQNDLDQYIRNNRY
jgi:hypothetical protein